nr:FxSxx-COOH system tetratricopeptide repeat protein [Kibdelosporangium sp. MJ126-NF4]CEL17030.1 putative ATP /GTP-binding protein [Kibdelosporangium sp. MJ126-NF4]CTQ91740.1 putative ATP /GTP-binding protein [Kibdelosporangium sp. MJ126-NF4]
MSALPSDEPPGREPGLMWQVAAGPRPTDLTWSELRDIWWLVRCVYREPPEAPPAEIPPVDDVPRIPESKPPERSPSTPEAPPENAQPKRKQPEAAEQWTPRQRGALRQTLADTTRATAPLGWPGVPALRNPRAIEQALRPLTRRVPSPWRKVLDEEATARRAAEERIWLPEWQPAPWRKFELMLIVDSSPTLAIWRNTIDEFTGILGHIGAFRQIRTYRTDFSRPKDLTLSVDGTGAQRSWRDVVDPTGRRVVLVITDAIGPAWRTGAAEHRIAELATGMPTAIVNVLSDRLWSWGGLSPHRAHLSSPTPGAANRMLRVEPEPHDAIAVPVLAMSPEWLAGWATLVAGGATETTAIHVSPAWPVEASYPKAIAEPYLAARERVLRFKTYASTRAFHLACLLAAAPLNLPIMRLVEQVMLDGSDMSTVAEVLLGGIVKETPVLRLVDDPAAIAYEFYDGVREELLSMGTRVDTVRVARVVSDAFGAAVPILKSLRNAIDFPATAPQPVVTDQNMPYLKIEAAVLSAISGGPYTKRSRSLTNRLNEHTNGGSHERVEPAFAQTGAEDAASSRSGTSISSGRIESMRTASVEGEMSVSETPRTEPRQGAGLRPQIWGNVPLRNPDFVGRTELLDKLQERLLEPDNRATAVLPEALHGMGGVGKSQTVVEYIYRHSTEYDIIWWIPSEQLSQINASFVELARKLGLPSSSADTARPEVIEALRKGSPYQRWLLVFDNAEHPDVVSPFIPASSGHVIVTSRNPDWAGVARTVEVDLFTRKESIDLLRMRGGEITDEDADRLAEALGDLPLAVEQAAAWRGQTGMPVNEYLTLLDRHLTDLLGDERAAEYGALGYQRSVAAAWNVPLHRLRTSHPAALQLLQVCAFFGPEPIARSLFTGGRSVPVPPELANALRDPIKLNRAIREISRYSLAKIDHRNNTIQLHRLVQTVLKNQLSEKDQGEMRHAVHVLLVNGDPDDPVSTDSWPRYADLLPHATMSKAVECQSDAWVRRLIINLVRYLVSIGDYQVALSYARESMDQWTLAFGETHEDTLLMASQRSIALRRIGEYDESFELIEETYKRVQETYGEDSELYLSVADTLRSGLRVQGRFVQELQMQENIVEKSRHVLGDDDPATLRYANNLAGSLRLNGQFFRAKEVDQDTGERKKVVLGDEHGATFLTLNGLAMDLRECGEYVEACRVQEYNLTRQRAVMGDDHPSTIGAMRNLAVSRRKAGLHQEARELSEDCVRLYRLRYGDKHLDTITAEMGLSADLRVLGDLPQSESLGAHSYQLFVETHGQQHPFTLVAAINLAITTRLMKRAAEARDANRRTLESLHQVFGKDHPFALVCATNLASDLAALGDAAAAHAMDVDTRDRSIQVLGEKHPSTLAVALNLSIDLDALGKKEEAAKLHAATVTLFRSTLGPDHPATLAADQSIRANCDTDTMQL